MLYAGGRVGEVEPEGAAGHQHQGLQQSHVGEEAGAQRQSLMVAYLDKHIQEVIFFVIMASTDSPICLELPCVGHMLP